MTLKETHMAKPRKERPTLWTWMQKPRNVWAHYILAVHKGKEGHWILVKGVKMCDTYTEGRWTFVVDGPHRGARIMEIFEVRSRSADCRARSMNWECVAYTLDAPMPVRSALNGGPNELSPHHCHRSCRPCRHLRRRRSRTS